jgi:ElaB/YqjD/DUF883 family membrane-anchored ribosome-binding protein
MADENQREEGPSASPQAAEKAERGATHSRQAGEDLRSAVGATTDEYLGRAEGIWNDTRDRVRSFQDDGERYVRENPTKAVFAALGVGFLLGFTFRR